MNEGFNDNVIDYFDFQSSTNFYIVLDLQLNTLNYHSAFMALEVVSRRKFHIRDE